MGRKTHTAIRAFQAKVGVRLVDRRRIKSRCFVVSSLQFGKASIKFIVIHFLHDAEYVLDDHAGALDCF